MALRLDGVDVLDDVGVVELLEKVDLTLRVSVRCVSEPRQSNTFVSRPGIASHFHYHLFSSALFDVTLRTTAVTFFLPPSGNKISASDIRTRSTSTTRAPHGSISA